MTNEYELADNTRAKLIYEKQDLLGPLLPGMVEAPHPMVPGTDDQDYYRGMVRRGYPGAGAVRRRASRGRRAPGSRSELGSACWPPPPRPPGSVRPGPSGSSGRSLSSRPSGCSSSRKAVHCALLLALTMMSLAVLYLARTHFLGVVQVVVYTGAVMMLFLFVLMLVGVDRRLPGRDDARPAGRRCARGLGFGALLIFALGDVIVTNDGLEEANADGNVVGLADLIFTRYVFAFEVTSALLITAAIGAMVLAHRERHEPRATQRELSVERFREGGYGAPLPPPGVFARHNAVDTPALLPDGTPAETSVSRVLVARGDVRRAPGTPSESTEVARREEDES